MKNSGYEETILGIDLGPNSIGWTLFASEKEKPKEIIGKGVRLFEAGLDDLELDGKGKSRNVQRREARSRRRLLGRRTRRLTRLAHLLQSAGLLPEGDLDSGEQRHRFFTEFDRALYTKWSDELKKSACADLPYLLRALALDNKLTPHEFGRALYHLAQRRGFLSNRRSEPKKDEDHGKVKDGISELTHKMAETKSRTLGEYFSGLDPHEKRIRDRYTSRSMYEDEFEKIWEAQKKHYPDILAGELKKRIDRAIFYQRPLKNQKHLIGECQLEEGRRRAPWALLISQRFRYLQRLNDLCVMEDGIERPLIDDEREELINAFETEGDLKFSRMRTLLGFPRTKKFNLERGGEKKLPGNRTAAKLLDVFGERWAGFSDEEKDAVVEDMRSIVKDETLKRRGMNRWGLDEESAEKFSHTGLDEGHCSFSRRALEKLLPHLEEGVALNTVIREFYPERWERAGAPVDKLPPVKSDRVPEIRNPVVERTLTELRRVVNAIVRRYGKPEFIRIELARDLRQNSKQRENAYKRMRQNEKRRKDAAQKILKEVGIEKPSRADIEKYMLAEECNWKCPYTGRSFSAASLFGEHPQFDVEHIIPLDRSLDNSFVNKTLCHAEENRTVKGKRTPYEAYHSSGKWDEIIHRVGDFKGDLRNEKLKRFKYTDEDVEKMLGDFTSRQLNDTRYAARLAKQYLGLLYGGVKEEGIDQAGKRRVQAVRGGQVTAFLRNEWKLNGILGDGPGKSREDHRHHAVDAAVVGLTNPGTVKMLSDAAKRASSERRRFFGKVEAPWEGFLDDVRKAVDEVVASHRVSRRVRGALHEETFYSFRGKNDKGKEYVHVRKHISALSPKDMENIVDPVVRERVREKLAELGGDKKKFAAPENHPFMITGDGKKIPIHRVRIRRNLKVYPVGAEHRKRHVTPDTNHHMEIVGALDGEGNVVKWEGEVVSLLEAHRRKRAGGPIVKREYGEGKRFLFSLANGEIIELDNEDGSRGLYVVRTVPQSKQIRFVPINDARKLTDIPKTGHTAVPSSLQERHCRKMTVSLLGEVRYARD